MTSVRVAVEWMYVCICKCMHACVCVCVCVRMYLCAHVYTYMLAHVQDKKRDRNNILMYDGTCHAGIPWYGTQL